MRNQKKIIIDIDPEGNCHIDGKEFSGTECAHFINEIEETLGERTSQTNKPEYHQKHTIPTRNRQVGSR